MVSHMSKQLREHLAYQLLYELSHAPLGRRTLVERTGLTESVVRTELEKLEAQRLVTFSKLGTALIERGRRTLSAMLSSIAGVQELCLKNLMLDKYSRAAHVRGAADDFRAWFYRDLAVRAGATAALFLRHRKGALCLLEEEKLLAEQNPDDAQLLKKAFPNLRSGDLLVIVFGPERGLAAKGLWAVLCALRGSERLK